MLERIVQVRLVPSLEVKELSNNYNIISDGQYFSLTLFLFLSKFELSTCYTCFENEVNFDEFAKVAVSYTSSSCWDDGWRT